MASYDELLGGRTRKKTHDGRSLKFLLTISRIFVTFSLTEIRFDITSWSIEEGSRPNEKEESENCEHFGGWNSGSKTKRRRGSVIWRVV